MDGYASVCSVVHCLIIDNKHSTVRYGTVPYCIFIEYMPTGKTNIPLNDLQTRDSSINFLHT